MLNAITKTMNKLSRFISNDEAVKQRTIALDGILDTYNAEKKNKTMSEARDIELALQIETLYPKVEVKVSVTTATNVASMEADVEEDTTTVVHASYDEWTDVVEMYWISTADLNTLEKNDEEVGNKIATYIAHQNAIKNGKKGKLTKKEIRDMAYYIYDALEENVSLGHKESESIRTFLVANAEKSSINFMNALVVAFVNDKN